MLEKGVRIVFWGGEGNCKYMTMGGRVRGTRSSLKVGVVGI